MKPLYIFDLDGTLANIEHRLYFIENGRNDWRSFYRACGSDEPIPAAITTLQCLQRSRAEIWIWTGRSDEVRRDTEEWLVQNGIWRSRLNPFRAPEALLMRRAGDHRPDVEVKREWLSMLEPPEHRRLTAVFEDRKSVVQMWRATGVPCFQVAPGEF